MTGRPVVDANPKPWFRQPDESRQAYETFCVYRDLLGARNTREAARLTGRDRRDVERWSRAHDWVRRVDQFDHHLQELHLKTMETEVVAMSKRQAQQAASLQAALGLYLNELAARLQDPGRRKELVSDLKGPDLMKAIQAIAWPLSRAAMLERIARGAKDGVEDLAALGGADPIVVKMWHPPRKPQNLPGAHKKPMPGAVEAVAAKARAEDPEAGNT